MEFILELLLKTFKYEGKETDLSNLYITNSLIILPSICSINLALQRHCD